MKQSLEPALAEAALAEMQDGILLADQAENLLFANKAAAKLLRRAGRSLVGLSLSEAFEASARGTVGDLIARAKEQPGLSIYSTLRSSDKVLSAEVMAFKKEGGASGLIVTIRDTTELVLARERAEAVLASTADGLVVLNEAGSITHINRTAQQLLKVSEADAVGKTVSLINEPKVAEALARHTRPDDTPKDAPVSTEVTLKEPEIKVLKIISTPVITEDKKVLGFVKTIRDITTEKQVDRMKSEFISTVSHELRTPLTSIKGYVDLILEGDAGDIEDMQRDFLNVVKQNSDRLVSLINDLLDLSRIESGRVQLKKEPIQVDKLINQAVDSIRPMAESKHQELKKKVAGPLPIVIGDADRITQIITNLLSNAVKYTPESGHIELEALSEGERILISVRDDGVGITPEDQIKLFEKFYRVDNSLVREVGGTGLGLSIVKTLVELHGGEIWIESEPNVGSVFYVALPTIGKSRPKVKVEHDVEEPAFSIRGKKILVVDDEPDIVRLIELQLKKEGYEVITALSGERALEIAASEQPDLITLDVLMEGINGFEVIRRLNENKETAHIPVVIISIICDEDQCYTFGGASYIGKPIDPVKFNATVKNLLKQSDASEKTILIINKDHGGIASVCDIFQGKNCSFIQAANVDDAIAKCREAPDLVLLDDKAAHEDAHKIVDRLRKHKPLSKAPIILLTGFHSDKVLELELDDRCQIFTPDVLANKIEQVLEERRADEPIED